VERGLRRIGMRTKDYYNNYYYYYHNPQFNDWSCRTVLLLIEEGRRKMMNKMMTISVQLQQLPDQILMHYSLILHHLLHPSTN
jgi:hypothetical protein